MDNSSPIYRSEDEFLDGSTVQRPASQESIQLGSTASATPFQMAGMLGDSAALLESEPSGEAKTVIRKSDLGSASKTGPSKTGPGAPAGSPASVAKVLLGTHLNHFLLEEMIGGGGMGAVFRARDERLDRIVAIKVIPFVSDDQDLQRRFRNEAQNAARLDHPYIARVFDVGRYEEWHYIVFEHVEGINLRDLVAREGVLSIDDAVFYTRQIAEALEHANGRGVVHRDIKPSNVLVDVEGNVKVVDMGLARSQQVEVSEDMTASGVTLGTFDYISPEQARDPRDADVRSDIYSLGCTLYYMLTASPPYPGGTMLQKLLSHGNAPPPDPRGLRPEVSDNLTAIIHKMLAKDPNARYLSAIDVVADLRELAIREGLIRAQSRGTLAIAPTNPISPLLSRHLPWMVAVTLLIVSCVWLQILSSAGREEFNLVPPPSAVALRLGSFDDAPLKDGATVRSDGGDAVPALNENGAVPVIAPPNAATSSDQASIPPAFSGLAMQNEPAGSLPNSLPPADVSPVAVERIVVVNEGVVELEPSSRPATSLRDAIKLAGELNVNQIDIAVPTLTSLPIKITRDNLKIRSTVGQSEIKFVAGELLSMQRVAMMDVGSHPIEFQNLHFSWNVRGAVTDGGSFLTVSANRLVRLVNCTVTIENLTQRDEVYAFEVGAQTAGGENSIAATESPASQPTSATSSPSPSPSPIPEGTQDSTLGSRPAQPNGTPPLVAIELQNVAIRGEIAMLNIVDAVQLQFRWDNGLLAVSRRMVDASGAVTQPSVAANRMQLSFNRVTVWAQEGLFRMRLGPSGAYPMLIDRDSTKSVFHCAPSADFVEFTGLEAAVADPGALVQLRGEDNAYDFDLASDPTVLKLGQWDGKEQRFLASALIASDKPSWVTDRSPRWTVRWSAPVPAEVPFSRLTAAHFSQDGTLLPGFDANQLPVFPPKVIDSKVQTEPEI